MPEQQTPHVKGKPDVKLATFIADLSEKESLEQFSVDVNNFLATIDNVHRSLSGRNAFAIGEDKICVQIWYIQANPPETEELGSEKDEE